MDVDYRIPRNARLDNGTTITRFGVPHIADCATGKERVEGIAFAGVRCADGCSGATRESNIVWPGILTPPQPV